MRDNYFHLLEYLIKSETFMIVSFGKRVPSTCVNGDVTGISWVEDWDSGKLPITPRTTLNNNEPSVAKCQYC